MGGRSGQRVGLVDRGERLRVRSTLGAFALAVSLLTLATALPATATDGRRPAGPAGGGGLAVTSPLLAAADAPPFLEASQIPGGKGEFGASVALSADGDTAVVGAPLEDGGSGSAFVYGRTASGWQEQAQLPVGEGGGEATPCSEGEGEECLLGINVAISGDGDTVLVGSPREGGHAGSVRTFVRSGSGWAQLGSKLTDSALHGRALFGRSVALSADGETALVGAPGASAAVLLRLSGSTWVQEGATLTVAPRASTGRFGRTAALSADGDVALVGAPGVDGGAGRAWAYARGGEGAWTQQQELEGGPEEAAGGSFGSAVALSQDGGTALIGADGSGEAAGQAFVLVDSGGAWTQQGLLTPPGGPGYARFGHSVALSASGDEALVGGPYDDRFAGEGWTFGRSADRWSAGTTVVPPGSPGVSRFGSAVALSSDGLTALVGAPAEAGAPGSAWVLSTPPVPIVDSVEPAAGPSTGGTHVKISGSGFRPGATVGIGSLASSVDVLSETELEAVTARNPPGSYEVWVSDTGGTSVGGPSFTFTAPTSEHTVPPAPTETVAGSASQGGVLSTLSSVPPAPALGLTGNLAPVSGRVLVRLPGSHAFVALTTITQVPFGTLVDAEHGSVSVTTADTSGGTQTMNFYLGEFRLTQSHSGETVATLAGGDESVCRGARAGAGRAVVSSSKHVVRKLWASGHGHYSTSGHYAAGAVLGTIWLTEDLCRATLIRVITDRVAVTDFVTHRHFVVRAGHTYVARAR